MAATSEQQVWTKFEDARPLILGALLDAVAHGLRQLPTVHLDRLRRMADFARWSTARETAIWPKGTSWSAYCGNRDLGSQGGPVRAAGR
jgi:hypothetical protein